MIFAVSSERISHSDNQNIVDLEASDWILYNDGDSMMEIKNPNVDINVKIKKR